MNDQSSGAARPPSPGERDDSVLDWARREGAADLLVGGLDRYVRRRRRRKRILASTACAALLMATAATWLSTRSANPSAASADAVATATVLKPEQRTLPDGSTVDLNTGAEIDVAFTDAFRRITLRTGEAHFVVAKDAQRPFIVTAGTVEVRAVGTAFAVDLGSSAVDVVVTEGRVAVNPSASDIAIADNAEPPARVLTTLDAGRRVVIERATSASASAAPRISDVSAADIQARLAWRVPRLKFAATPLEHVVAMFNDHAAPGDARLVLEFDGPTDVRVSGMLRSDDIDSLLRLLAVEFGVSADRRDGAIVLRRK